MEAESRSLSSVSSSDLCEQCQQMAILDLFRDHGSNARVASYGFDAFSANLDLRVKRRSLLDLTRKSHCPLCYLILQSLPPEIVSRFELDRTHLCIYGASADHLLEVRLLSDGPTSTVYLMLDLFLSTNILGQEQIMQLHKPRICLGLSQPFAESKHGSLSRVSQRSERIDLQRLKEWTLSCEKSHSGSCSLNSRFKNAVPGLHLIDVQRRVIVSAPYKARYIALSYVWGKSIHIQPGLGRRLNNLPKTIEDALTVTSKLGERYLWVDAYCLGHQDSPERKVGLRLMHRVYNNALLTIFALSNRNADEGLPGVRPDSRSLFAQTNLVLDEKEIVSFLPKRLKDHFMEAYWSSRGWTMQEAYFSTRRLCFTEEEAFFWCAEGAFCETVEDGTLAWEPRILADEPGPFNLPTARQLPPRWTFSDYASLVVSYRSRQLTFQSDALAAFQGILSSMEEVYKMNFLCGLPANADFWLAMLWQHNDLFSSRNPDFPSWSWAGWSGSVCLPWRHDFWTDFSPVFPETRFFSAELPEGQISVNATVAPVLLKRGPPHRWQLQSIREEPIPLIEEHLYRNSMAAFDRFLGVSHDFGEPGKDFARRAEAMLVTNVAYLPWAYVMLLKVEGGISYRLGPIKLKTEEWERLRPVEKTMVLG